MRWLRCLPVFLLCLFLLHDHIGQAGEFDQKINQLRNELKQNPNNTEAMLSLAQHLSWSDQLEEALEYYRKTLKLEPDHVEAKIGMATIYAWQKKYPESIQIYKGILKKYPDDVTALAGLARVYSWMGNYQESIALFEQAKNYAPRDRDVLMGLGRVYGWNKQYKKSEQTFTKMLAETPDEIEVLKALANTYKWGEKFTKGIEIELRILTIEPNNVDSMLSIGYMYGQLGAIGQSIHWYEKASKLAPDRGDIQAHLGLLYTRDQQIDSAATAFKQAISLGRSSERQFDIESYISLGRIYSWQSKMEESEKLYKKAIEINPRSADAHTGLAQLYFFNGLWDKSIEQYEKSLKIDPMHVEALQGLERVKALRAPEFTTRYSHFINNFRDSISRKRTDKQYANILSHEYTHKFAPGKALQARAEYAQTASNDTNPGIDPSSGSPLKKRRDYLYNQYTLSLRLDYPLLPDLLANSLFFSGRYDQGWFDNHQGPHEFNFAQDQHFPSGFALLRYEKKRLQTLASISREPLVITNPNLLLLDPLDTCSASVIYDLTDDLSLIGNGFFQNFQKGRGYQDRRELRAISQYRLPFFKQMELTYEFQHQNHGNELRHVGGVRFTDRFFRDNLLADLSYRFESENASTNFGMTFTHEFRLFSSIELKKWLHLNSDFKFELERRRDRDAFQTYRVYLTVLLDKEIISGKYSVKSGGKPL